MGSEHQALQPAAEEEEEERQEESGHGRLHSPRVCCTRSAASRLTPSPMPPSLVAMLKYVERELLLE